MLLIPSAVYLWTFQDLPLFGDFHDDTLYFVSAKSLAEGNGYRIESLPGQPPQTKYPPLYPLLLSLAWRFGPEFPANLAWAGWLSWLSMPLLILWLLPALWKRWEMRPGQVWILAALFALNPYVLWLSSGLLTELYFLAAAIGAMLLLERTREGPNPGRWAIAAGMVTGVAYLTRSAGLALIPAGLLYLWWRGSSRRAALWYVASAAPWVLAWMAWARLNLTPTLDPSLTYYTDYFGYQLMNVSLGDLPLVLWKNIDGYLWGLGSLVVPKVERNLLLKIAAQVVAVGMISGAVRLVRSGRAQLPALFAALSSVLLLVWHFPPDERFVMPLWPLAFAGLLTEIDHLTAMLRAARQHRDRSQRIVAAGMTAGFAAAGVAALAYQAFVGLHHLPDDAHQHRLRRQQQAQAYAWIREHLPQDAAFFAQLDPLLYLHTGRAATSRPLPPREWYHEDHDAMTGAWGRVTEFAQSHGLTHYYAMDTDLSRNLDEDDQKAAANALQADPGLAPVYQGAGVTIYQVLAAPHAADLRTADHPPSQ